KRPAQKVHKVSRPLQRLVMAGRAADPLTGTLPATAWLATARIKQGKNTAIFPTCFSLIGTPQYCSGFSLLYRTLANTLGKKPLECALAKCQMLDAKTVRKNCSRTNINFYRPAP
ncbi:hypothetical protein ACNKU7_18730, partial [Microbulbifer sp. SA54]|uniref:hypothetical protein n=1 Tax=Microbulbifer sp. SA54 TaxID=3401577 RepID=UPI003AAEFB04